MRSPRGLLAISGYLAGRHAPAASVSIAGHHSLFFARTFQILAQPEPVRLQELSAPDSGTLTPYLSLSPPKSSAYFSELL